LSAILGDNPSILDYIHPNWSIYMLFYLPHMEYEGSIGFVMRKMIFFADFHVLGLFMAKKHDLSDKMFSICHAPLPLSLPLPLPLPLPYAKFVPRLQPRPFDLER
jgi:hypothetical protein